MVEVHRPPANGFVALARRVYNPLGFTKGYNFLLWFVLGGALTAFALARLTLLDVDGVLCGDGPYTVMPGDCYYFRRGRERAGIILHLGGILPAALLAVLQFVPALRHRALPVHRISGYIVILLSLAGVVGVFMIARHGMGGGIEIQTAAGLASIIFVVCKAIDFYNIKRLQIEQHRAWMLRAWVIASFIISLRIIGLMMAYIIGRPGGDYYTVKPCFIVEERFRGNRSAVEAFYPDCRAYFSGANPNVHVIIHADTTSGRPDQVGSAFNATFGAGGFLALFIHTIGVELYLRMTPAETERLRRVSYQRQIEAGIRNPGNGGLTVQRLGDAEPWFPEKPKARVGDKQDAEAKDAKVHE